MSDAEEIAGSLFETIRKICLPYYPQFPKTPTELEKWVVHASEVGWLSPIMNDERIFYSSFGWQVSVPKPLARSHYWWLKYCVVLLSVVGTVLYIYHDAGGPERALATALGITVELTGTVPAPYG